MSIQKLCGSSPPHFANCAMACAVLYPLLQITMLVIGILGAANVIPMNPNLYKWLIASPILSVVMCLPCIGISRCLLDKYI